LTPEGDLVSSRFFWTVVLLLGALPFSTARSFGSKRVVVPTLLSVITYIAWFVCTAHSHGKGNLEASAGWETLGSLWDDVCEPKYHLHPSFFAQLEVSFHCIRFHRLINCLPLQFVEGWALESQAQDQVIPILQDAPGHVRYHFLCLHPPSGVLQFSPLLWSKFTLHGFLFQLFNEAISLCRITPKNSHKRCEQSYTLPPSS
jgi:hypothetical protein